jgi:thymidylate synthase (FAD)
MPVPARIRKFDILRANDLEQRVFHPFPDNDEAGQVQLVDMMPRMVPEGLMADFAIPQMARVSYGIGTKKVSEDRGLIRYLKRHDHDSPFEAITFKFRIRCPIFVYRQWFRHRTTDQCEIEITSTDENARKFMSMNEYSARYSVVPDIFYIPKDIRGQSTTNKQGGEIVLDASEHLHGEMDASAKLNRILYENLLKAGVSRELAREILPVCYVTEFYMSANLLNLFRWLQLRLAPGAQQEIKVFAQYIAAIVKQVCPVAYGAFESYMLMAVKFSWEETILLRARIGDPFVSPDVAGIVSENMSKRELAEFEEKLTGPKIARTLMLHELKSSIPNPDDLL